MPGSGRRPVRGVDPAAPESQRSPSVARLSDAVYAVLARKFEPSASCLGFWRAVEESPRPAHIRGCPRRPPVERPCYAPSMAVTIVALAALALAAAPALAEKLVFSDDFDTLDEGKWVHQVSAWRGGNNEFQYYRNDRRNR